MKMRCLLIAGLSLMPLYALAHAADGGPHSPTFASGFVHPFTGWDHWLSFALIGVLAGRIGMAHRGVAQRSTLLPSAAVAVLFNASMLGGFYAAQRFVGLPYAEFAIAGLLIALGFVLVLMLRPTMIIGGVIAAFMGYVHGYVHGIELAGAWPAAVGSLAASALLSACGIALSATLQRIARASRPMHTVLGVVAVLLGVSLFTT